MLTAIEGFVALRTATRHRRGSRVEVTAIMSWIYLFRPAEVAFTTTIATRTSDAALRWTSLPLQLCGVAKSTASIPLGTAYAVWGGLDIGTASVGILFFNEPVAVARIVFLTLLVASIAGLELSAA